MTIESIDEALDLVVVKHDRGSLETNAAKILDEVRKRLTNYTPDNYSEDTLPEAKTDRASLNKASKALNERRIAIEKAHMASVNAGLDLIKQAVTEINGASKAIDNVVKTVEEREAKAKENEIREYFASTGFSLVVFERVFSPDMLNKTASIKSVKERIDASIAKIKGDIECLESMGAGQDASAQYLRTLDIATTIRWVNETKAAKARLEAAKVIPAPASQPTQTQETKPAPIEEHEPAKIEQQAMVLTRLMRVTGTEDQLIDLADWMDEQGITFEKVTA
jgi:exonuclease VII small subunit